MKPEKCFFDKSKSQSDAKRVSQSDPKSVIITSDNSLSILLDIGKNVKATSSQQPTLETKNNRFPVNVISENLNEKTSRFILRGLKVYDCLNVEDAANITRKGIQKTLQNLLDSSRYEKKKFGNVARKKAFQCKCEPEELKSITIKPYVHKNIL